MNNQDTLTSLLTLMIVLAGLAMIVGGPRAVAFLFAPFIAAFKYMIRILFVLLIIIVVLAALLEDGKRFPDQAPNNTSGPATLTIDD